MYSLFKIFQKNRVFLVVSFFQNIFFSIEVTKLQKPVAPKTLDISEDIGEYIYEIEKTVNENKSFVEKVQKNIMRINARDYIGKVNVMAIDTPKFQVESQKIQNKSLLDDFFKAVDISVSTKISENYTIKKNDSVLTKVKESKNLFGKIFKTIKDKEFSNEYSLTVKPDLINFLINLYDSSLIDRQKFFEIHLMFLDTKKKIGELFKKHSECAYHLICIHAVTLKKIELIKLETELLKNMENNEQQKIAEKYCDLVNQVCSLEIDYNNAIIQFQESEAKLGEFFGSKEETIEKSFQPSYPIFEISGISDKDFFVVPDQGEYEISVVLGKSTKEEKELLQDVKIKELHVLDEYLTHNRKMETKNERSKIKKYITSTLNIPKKPKIVLSSTRVSKKPTILGGERKDSMKAEISGGLNLGQLYSSVKEIRNIPSDIRSESNKLNTKYLEMLNKINNRKTKIFFLERSMTNLVKKLNSNVNTYLLQKDTEKLTENIKKIITIYKIQEQILKKKAQEIYYLVGF